MCVCQLKFILPITVRKLNELSFGYSLRRQETRRTRSQRLQSGINSKPSTSVTTENGFIHDGEPPDGELASIVSTVHT